MAVRVKPKNVQDIQEYVNDYGNDLEFSLVEKKQKVEARKVLSGSEEVRTVLADGMNETVNVAHEGDWIVNNVGSPEKWVVKDEIFRNKYSFPLDVESALTYFKIRDVKKSYDEYRRLAGDSHYLTVVDGRKNRLDFGFLDLHQIEPFLSYSPGYVPSIREAIDDYCKLADKRSRCEDSIRSVFEGYSREFGFDDFRIHRPIGGFFNVNCMCFPEEIGCYERGLKNDYPVIGLGVFPSTEGYYYSNDNLSGKLGVVVYDFDYFELRTFDNFTVMQLDGLRESAERNLCLKRNGMDPVMVCLPKGGPVLAAELKEDISFVAPWGERQVIRKGGFLICDPNLPNYIYGIDREVFEKTYARVDAEKDNLKKEPEVKRKPLVPGL